MCQNRGGGGGGVEKHCILLIFLTILSNIPLNSSLNILLNYLIFMIRLIVE